VTVVQRTYSSALRVLGPSDVLLLGMLVVVASSCCAVVARLFHSPRVRLKTFVPVCAGQSWR
jgi:hypothetical protein